MFPYVVNEDPHTHGSVFTRLLNLLRPQIPLCVQCYDTQTSLGLIGG